MSDFSDVKEFCGSLVEEDFGLFFTRKQNALHVISHDHSYNFIINAQSLKNAFAVRCENYYYIALTLEGTSSDAPKNFGATDVWIARLRI